MDPISIAIGIAIAAYAVGGIAVDGIAVAKRRGELPSAERARQRHERRKERGQESTDPASQGYFARILGNAVERWGDRSDQKHRARKQWIEEQGPKRSERWLDRKRRRSDRYERAAQAVADQRDVLWGKTKDAARAARERKLEREAWERNKTAPDVPEAPESEGDPRERIDSGSDETGGTVLPFRRPSGPQPDPIEVTGEAGDDGDTRLTFRRQGTGEVLPSDITGDPSDPTSWRGTDSFGRDIQTGRGASRQVDDRSVVHDDDTYLLGSDVSPERRIVQQHQHGSAPAHTPTDKDTTTSQHDDEPPTSDDTPRFQHPRVRWAWDQLTGEDRSEKLAALAKARNWRGTGIPDQDLAERAEARLTDPRHPRVAHILDRPEKFVGDRRDALAQIIGIPRPDPDRDPDDVNGYWGDLTELATRATRVLDTPWARDEHHLHQHITTKEDTAMTDPQQSTATGEITGLSDALDYTSQMAQRLGALDGETEATAQGLTSLSESCQSAAREVEQAISDLRRHGVEGNHVRALASAGEELTTIATTAASAAAALTTVCESITTAQTAFSNAHSIFQAQTGLQEEIQAANARGARAGNREFYEDA